MGTMSLSTKILITIGAIFSICLSSFIIYKQIEISAKQSAIEAEVVKQKELTGNITRSLNEYATRKDIEQFAKDSNVSLKTIQEDMDKLHAEIKSINVTKVSSGGVNRTNVPSTDTGPKNPNPIPPTPQCNGESVVCPNIDPYNYFRARQDLTLTEPFSNVSVPIGEVGFSGWNDKPWFIDIRPRTYQVTSVVGTDENQRQYFYNKFTISVDGKAYDVKIDDATTKQEYPEAKFSLWNPRLFLTSGGSFNLNDVQGSMNFGLSLGLMSYGRFKTAPDISILQIGATYETATRKPAIIINPFNYNIGSLLPKGLINSTYIGPSIQTDITGNVFIGGNISTGL